MMTLLTVFMAFPSVAASDDGWTGGQAWEAVFAKTGCTGPPVVFIVAQESTGCRCIQRSHMLGPVPAAPPRRGRRPSAVTGHGLQTHESLPPRGRQAFGEIRRLRNGD